MKGLLIGLAASLLVAPGLLAGESQPESCASQFLMRVQGEHIRVQKGSAFRVRVELLNSGPVPRWVYKNLALGVWLNILDPLGFEVQPNVLYDHLPPSEMNLTDFIRVLPGHSLVLHDEYPEAELGLPHGRYVAKFDFMFMPAEEVFASACWGWLHGTDEVSFEIVE